jgi:hypothetical protein
VSCSRREEVAKNVADFGGELFELLGVHRPEWVSRIELGKKGMRSH